MRLAVCVLRGVRYGCGSQLWRHAFSTVLRAEPTEHPVLLTEPALNPPRNREEMTKVRIPCRVAPYRWVRWVTRPIILTRRWGLCVLAGVWQIMFETFEVPSLFVASSAVLTLYNGGRETGLVVSAGESFTDVVPIYESVVMTHAVQRLHVGGGALTARLRQQLLAGGVPASALAKPGAVQSIKEALWYVRMSLLCLRMWCAHRDGALMLTRVLAPRDCSYCAADLDAELAAAKSGDAGKVSHKLPDGTVISVGQERFTCAEALFNPGLVGQDYADGIGAATSLAIRYCEPEMRKDMTGSIVVTGGTSMLRGFPARLTTEIQAHMAPKAAESVRVDAGDDRRYGAWVGGSILAQLPLFDSMCVTSQEYEEQGPSIIHRKC